MSPSLSEPKYDIQDLSERGQSPICKIYENLWTLLRRHISARLSRSRKDGLQELQAECSEVNHNRTLSYAQPTNYPPSKNYFKQHQHDGRLPNQDCLHRECMYTLNGCLFRRCLYSRSNIIPQTLIASIHNRFSSSVRQRDSEKTER